LTGRTLLISATHSYHTNVEPSIAVFELATQAFQQLRLLVLPPAEHSKPLDPVVRTKKPLGRSTTTRAPTPRTPKSTGRTVSDPKISKKVATVKAVSSGTSSVSSIRELDKYHFRAHTKGETILRYR